MTSIYHSYARTHRKPSSYIYPNSCVQNVFAIITYAIPSSASRYDNVFLFLIIFLLCFFLFFCFGLEMRPREANRTGSPVAHLFTNWTNRMTNFNRKYVSGDARMCVFELVLWAMYLIVDGRLQVCVHVAARQHCIQVTHSHINTLLPLLLLSPSLNYF